MLEFNQYQKSIKATFIIYADCEYLMEKFDGCKNNLESTSTAKMVNIFHQFFQCIQYRYLKAYKIKMRSRLHEKVLRIIKTARNEDN